MKPDHATRMKQMQEHIAASLASRPGGGGPEPYDRRVHFLAYWLEQVTAAGIPHIPGEKIGSAPIGDLRRAMWEPHEPNPTVAALVKLAMSGPAAGMMYRWDMCASLDLKIRMGEPGMGNCPTSKEVLWMMLDDPRLDDILGDLMRDPTEPIILWQRPWVKATIEAGFPVEFRAFVLDSRVQGVCSYYPQRPLPAKYASHLKQVHDLTVKLQEHTRQAAFSADWLLSEHGSLLWLEGGPPHLPDRGAHPCCFPPCKIEGFLLAPVEGAIIE